MIFFFFWIYLIFFPTFSLPCNLSSFTYYFLLLLLLYFFPSIPTSFSIQNNSKFWIFFDNFNFFLVQLFLRGKKLRDFPYLPFALLLFILFSIFFPSTSKEQNYQKKKSTPNNFIFFLLAWLIFLPFSFLSIFRDVFRPK